MKTDSKSNNTDYHTFIDGNNMIFSIQSLLIEMEIVKDRTLSSPCSCNSIRDIRYKKCCSTLSSKMVSIQQLREYLLSLLAQESKGRWTICAGTWAVAGFAHWVHLCQLRLRSVCMWESIWYYSSSRIHSGIQWFLFLGPLEHHQDFSRRICQQGHETVGQQICAQHQQVREHTRNHHSSSVVP